MRTVGVIPAAGRGSRLGLEQPKLLAPLVADVTPWSLLRARLLPLLDALRVVVSPLGAPLVQAILATDPERERISMSVQETPHGMGDAIFSAHDAFRDADVLVVVWGDQVAVSGATLRGAIERHGGVARRVVLPTARLEHPYVEYRFDEHGRLEDVLQEREGDETHPWGLGDVGTFVLSVPGLLPAWERYVGSVELGRMTAEVNFLPFLTELAKSGWDVEHTVVADPGEARGLNDRSDLEWIRERLSAGSPR